MPELFPRDFEGFQLIGHRVSAKQGVTIRRLRLKDGTTYSIRPSFLMPYMTARTADVEGPLSCVSSASRSGSRNGDAARINI